MPDILPCRFFTLAGIDAGGNDFDFRFTGLDRRVGKLFDGEILKIVGKRRKAKSFHDVIPRSWNTGASENITGTGTRIELDAKSRTRKWL